jgi:NADPH:quinone reductase-like Zn-dependent oxidoreductase
MLGIFVQSYPNVLGSDIAGEVHKIGEDVTHLKKGDRVMAYATGLITGNPADGGYQLYTACKALVVAKIPSAFEYTSAAVLPVSISTASACLFKKETLALPLPTIGTKPSSSGKSVLVWGGSGSVGASAIQLAVGAGVRLRGTLARQYTD